MTYIDAKQKLDLPLAMIVPEYQSKNPIVRWLFERRLRVALRYLQQTNSRVIADIGCGDGSFIKLVQATKVPYDTVYGLDLNPAVVQLADEIPGVTFRVEHLEETHLPDASIDAIVCLDTLEHIEHLQAPLHEYARVLRPGGFLITSEPVESTLYKSLRFVLKGTYSQESGPGAGVHYHNARQIDAIVRQAGFTRCTRTQIPVVWPFDLFHIALYQYTPR